MCKSLRFKYRASRAETSPFFLYAAAFPACRKTIGDLFLTIHKTRAHLTDTKSGSCFPVHGHRSSPLFSIYLNIFKGRSWLSSRSLSPYFMREWRRVLTALFTIFNMSECPVHQRNIDGLWERVRITMSSRYSGRPSCIRDSHPDCRTCLSIIPQKETSAEYPAGKNELVKRPS